MAVGVGGVNLPIPEIPLWKDSEPTDPEAEPCRKALCRRARLKALALWLEGPAEIAAFPPAL